LYRVIWDGGRPNRVFLLTSKSLFLSLDEGDTWTDLSAALAVVPRRTFPLFNALAVDRTSGIVYAVGAGGGGVFRSDDPQRSWVLLSSPFQNIVVRTLLVHPLRSDTLYAATFSGFFKSEDAGRSWFPSNSGLPSPLGLNALAIDPVDPEVLCAAAAFGVFRSDDGGRSWSLFLSGGLSLSILSLAITTEGTLYVGSSQGCFRRDRGAADWNPINTGLPGLTVSSVAVDALSRTRVYAAVIQGGFFPTVGISEDAGRNWSMTHPSGNYEGSSVVAADPSAPGIAYVGTTGCVPRPPETCYGSLYKTTDGGSHWRPFVVPGGPGAVLAITVDPTRPEVIFVTGQIQIPGSLGFRSLDGGSSWTAFGNSFPSAPTNRILTDAQAPETIFAATGGKGVFRSSDRGTTWQPTGLTTGLVNTLAQDSRTGYLYAATDGGLFESRDAGTSWTLRAFTDGVGALAVDPRSGSLYAAVVHGGVQASADGGKTWSPIGGGLPDVVVRDLAISSGLLYAATNVGLYVFEFRGLHNSSPR
jgi:photosystem II stability/assembly factor-like uncharacterized protein